MEPLLENVYWGHDAVTHDCGCGAGTGVDQGVVAGLVAAQLLLCELICRKVHSMSWPASIPVSQNSAETANSILDREETTGQQRAELAIQQQKDGDDQFR